jgi:membrane protein YqaA with SNARE-associated domain
VRFFAERHGCDTFVPLAHALGLKTDSRVPQTDNTATVLHHFRTLCPSPRWALQIPMVYCHCMTLKDRMAGYAQQPQAENALFFMSMAESAFAPAAAESLLVPMSLINPDKAFRYALVATLGSLAGALGGYILGNLAARIFIEPIAANYGFESFFYTLRNWYQGYDVAVVATAGFSPLPFKAVAIGSGVLGAQLPAFLMATLIARGARFWLISWLLWRGGPRFKEWIERNLAALTMSISLGLLLFFILIKYLWQYAS